MRIETGPYKPEDERWPGVFIRGDDALHQAGILRAIRDNRLREEVRQLALNNLIDLLNSCDVDPE